MGQKVHPKSLRLFITDYWSSKWFPKSKVLAQYLGEDSKIRSLIEEKFPNAAISRIDIERVASNVRVTLFSARPGLIIGRRGKELDDLKFFLSKTLNKTVNINIVEIRRPDLDAKLIAQNIAFQIERRAHYKRAMKEALNRAIRNRTQGVMIVVSGRLGGAEIARSEKYRHGRVPRHTLRADIDYGFAEALTKYGIIGVKVWVYKGEKLSRKSPRFEMEEAAVS